MSKFGTNSWQTREALADYKPFQTHGAFQATGAESLPWGHRLPAQWAERFNADYGQMIYVVWSYNTPIAWVLEGGQVVKVDHKWSVTTTRHQGMLYALDASVETKNSIRDAAQRERQQDRDRRAQARERDMQGHAEAEAWRASEGYDVVFSPDAMRSDPQDYDALVNEVQGMLVR